MSIVAGTIAFAAVAAAGSVYVLGRPTTYTATASVVVLPSRSVSETAVSGYYETLSRGQIVETYAEMFRLPEWSNAAISAQNLSTDTSAEIETSASVVPSTAVIDVTATAPSGATAEAVVDDLVNRTSQYIASLSQPYDVRPISDATGTAKASGIPKVPFLAVVLVVGAVVGVAVQQLTLGLVRARERSRPPSRVPPREATGPAGTDTGGGAIAQTEGTLTDARAMTWSDAP